MEPLRYDGQSDHPEEVAGILRAMMPTGVRVLEVGCGTGSVTLIANHGKGNEVVAIEPDPQRAALARSRGVNAMCCILDEAFVAGEQPFDVVMMADVLEHMADPGAALKLVRAALKPGGHLLISVPNVAHWTVRLNLLFGRFDYAEYGIMDVTHLRWFYSRTIRRLVEDAGLTIVAMRQTAGVQLPVYQRSPFRHVPKRALHAFVRTSNRLFPTLFGCQHVIKAVLTN
ncbi:class I SAM-dependent methyltransferase [Phenylobacterium sp.]|uniref:class I SAM-dependent methyltransferase n=1 Tax=Phenylobacterium sp. TaxID=1871053 RepID=UPI002F40D697